MKKSKFLKSSRDMLSRSFNPSKCKTSLRLAGSRLKLLRNKKEVQVKQMKREIAQLLESGQDQTARIRVEHVAREEKMMAAYDLIELYCELIIARLTIIESQKICPIDLKEAIASVVFASPRCGDVPELVDVRKHFTEKYGKDFITAAVELRPECGVSRMLVEKLSAVAPDGQTKIKILSAIAEEHNVKWDPKSFSENSVPASDLLNGSRTFQEEIKLDVEPSHSEGPVHQVTQSMNKVHDFPTNITRMDNRTSLGTESLASTKTSGINTSFQHKTRPQALHDENTKLFQGDSNTLSLERDRWNMEFKDATSAAQAAAESAELASIAARAAAELSTRDRIMRQNSTESHNPDADILNDGGHERYMNSKFFSGQSSEESMNRSFSESQNEQLDRMKPNNLKTDGRFKDSGLDGRKEYSQSASLKSKASSDNNSLDYDVPVVDRYSRKNSLKEVTRGGTSMEGESYRHRPESANEWLEKSENDREERIGKQSSVRSSHSHSSISNDVNIFSNSEDQKYEYEAGEDSFLGFGKKGIYGEASQADSRESTAVVFDKSDSDSENHGFDMSPTYEKPKQRLHVPLSGQKSHEHLSTNTGFWSPTSSTRKTAESSSLFPSRESSSTNFSERSMDGSKLDDSRPVVFDQSDGSTSESDEDMNISRHTRTSRDFLSTQNQSVGSEFRDNEPSLGSSLKEKGSPLFDKQSSISSDDGLKSEEDRESYQGKKLGAGNSTPESEGGLNFEKLTGGFRHKGYNHPPFLKNRFDASPSFNKESEETTATISKTTAPPAVASTRIRTKIKYEKSRIPYRQSSDSDDSEEEESLRKTSDHKQERYTPTIGKNVKTIQTLAASNSIFGSDNSDSDEDRPKESFSRIHHLRSGISQRTKAFPSSSGKLNYAKTQLKSETLDSDYGMDRKATTSTIFETAKRSESQRNSSKLEIFEQPTSIKVASKPANSNSWGTQDQHNSGKANSETKHESKVSRKPSAVEESSMQQKQTGASISRENSKVAAVEKTSSNKDASNQNASHVHPKLPDYDNLVHLLQKNRS